MGADGFVGGFTAAVPQRATDRAVQRVAVVDELRPAPAFAGRGVGLPVVGDEVQHGLTSQVRVRGEP